MNETLIVGKNINLICRFTAGSGNNFTAKIGTVSNVVKRFYYLKDYLGSVRVVVNNVGEIVSSDDYDPWGMILNGRSTDGSYLNAKYKFTSKEKDVETGYDYFGARYYDSRIGRWLQVDPLAEKYFGWSPYNYTLNNPLKFYDPDGKGIKPSDEQRKRLEQKAKEYEQNKMEFAGAWESGSIWDKVTSTFNVTWDVIEKGFEEFSLMPTPAAIISKGSSAYTIAKSGGKHSGLFGRFAHETISKLTKSIRSLEGNISLHQEKILNPSKYIKNWDKLSKQNQQNIITDWQSEIKTYREQIEVFQGMIDERALK